MTSVFADTPTSISNSTPCMRTATRSRRAIRASFCLAVLPFEDQRAQGMPGARRARSLACKNKKAHEQVTTVTPETPGIPRAMVLTVSFALSRVTGLVCHPRPRKLPSANLTPASGRQDHTTSPSALSALRRCALSASTASRPASVTIASRPSSETGQRGCIADLGSSSMPPVAADWHDGQINLTVMAGSSPA
jgi:hypothetical protein